MGDVLGLKFGLWVLMSRVGGVRVMMLRVWALGCTFGA